MMGYSPEESRATGSRTVLANVSVDQTGLRLPVYRAAMKELVGHGTVDQVVFTGDTDPTDSPMRVKIALDIRDALLVDRRPTSIGMVTSGTKLSGLDDSMAAVWKRLHWIGVEVDSPKAEVRKGFTSFEALTAAVTLRDDAKKRNGTSLERVAAYTTFGDDMSQDGVRTLLGIGRKVGTARADQWVLSPKLQPAMDMTMGPTRQALNGAAALVQACESLGSFARSVVVTMPWFALATELVEKVGAKPVETTGYRLSWRAPSGVVIATKNHNPGYFLAMSAKGELTSWSDRMTVGEVEGTYGRYGGQGDITKTLGELGRLRALDP